MLAGIKISDGSSDKHKSDKKKKKKNKHKKRKLKKEKAKGSSSDSDSSAPENDDGVELLQAQSEEPSITPSSSASSVVRDTWMTLPMKSAHMTAMLSDRAAKKEAEERKKQQEEEAREALEEQAKIGGLKGDARSLAEKSTTAVPLVGDGGARWRAKALQRAQERAREEGVDSATAMEERFGSLSAFKAKDSELKQELYKQRGYSDKSREEQRHRFQRGGDDRTSESHSGGSRGSWRSRQDDRSSRRREEVVPKPGQDEFGRDLDEASSSAAADTITPTAAVQDRAPVSFTGSRQERWRKRDPADERARSPRRRSRERGEEREEREDRRGEERGERRREEREDSRDEERKERIRERIEHAMPEKDLSARFGAESTSESPARPVKSAKALQREAEQEKELAERRAFLYGGKQEALSREVVEDEEDKQPEEDAVVSEADLNKLAAKALKAKLMGDSALAANLEKELAAMRNRKARQPRVAVLSEMDAKGRLHSIKRPQQAPAEQPQPHQKQKRMQNKVVNGERVAYFDSDVAKTDLKSLVEAERLRGAEDYDANWARNIANNADFKEVSLEQQWDDVDVSMKMFQSKKDRITGKDKQAEYAHKQQVNEYNKLQRTLDNCRLCVAQAPQHLIIANGLRMYLSLPTHRIVTEGHCILAPMDHTPALTHFDEDVVEEFQYFRKHLVKMFAKQGKGVVFMETYMHPDRTPHSMIECVPLPLALFEEAAIYFKKEISDSDAKWSVHKKLIDTREKGLRRSVAKQAPYFSVEFGMEAGFAHVIEDPSKFPMDFGKAVLCGILEEPAQIVMRAKRQPEHMERERAEAFKKLWKPFDWTLRLKKNQPNANNQVLDAE